MRRHVITLKLTQRPDGMYCKKIAGKLRYFGYAGCDEATARRELIEYVRLLEAGEVPATATALTASGVADRYAVVCEARIARNEGLQQRTWDTYAYSIEEFVQAVGANTSVGKLGADQFAAVARKWRTLRGVHRVNNDIQAVRSMFRWAFENGLIDRTPIYGRAFSKSPSAHARIEGIARRESRGERRFTADELRKIIKGAKGQMKAMILLALNSGLYSVDVADLKWSDMKREGTTRYIDTTRHKTGIPRRFILWPETVKAVESLERHGDLMFVTSHGNPWNNRNHTDSIGLMFRRLLVGLGIKREGVGFGAFRHTHVSAVGDHPDQAAARVVRGHIIPGIERHYDFPSLQRINSVTDHARKHLIQTGAGRSIGRGRGSSQRPANRGRVGRSVV